MKHGAIIFGIFIAVCLAGFAVPALADISCDPQTGVLRQQDEYGDHRPLTREQAASAKAACVCTHKANTGQCHEWALQENFDRTMPGVTCKAAGNLRMDGREVADVNGQYTCECVDDDFGSEKWHIDFAEKCTVIDRTNADEVAKWKAAQTKSEKVDISCAPPLVGDNRCAFKIVCWFCVPFDKVLEIIPQVQKAVFEELKGPLFKLMAALFALWTAFHVFLFLTKNLAGGGPSGTETYQTLIGGTFRLLIASTLLTVGIDAIMDVTINYVIGVGLYVAYQIVQSGKTLAGGIAVPCGGDKAASVFDNSGAGFELVRNNFRAILEAFNDQVMTIAADGWTLIKHAFATGHACLIPQFPPFVGGILILAFGLALVVRVPLRLIDQVFQLTIVCVLLPVMIVSWVFPYSRQYTQKAFDMLMGVIGTFITMAVMIAIISGVLGVMFSEVKDVTTSEALANILNWETPEKMFGWVGTLLFCYMGFGAVNDLAETMFNAHSTGMAAEMVKAGDKLVAAAGGKAASFGKKGVKGAANMAAYGVKRLVR